MRMMFGNPLRAIPIAWIAILCLALLACDGRSARAAIPDAGATASAVVLAGPDASAPADTIDLRRIGHAEGSADAPVTVIEFSDFGCPFCAMFARGTYPQLRREFVETGKVRWIYVPFVMGTFRNGTEAARAAECAAEQDRFREMKDRLYADQNGWRNARPAAARFARYAAEIGLEQERFDSCYREDRRGRRTFTNNRAADALGIRATPSFLIQGRLVEGAVPIEQFRALLTRLVEAGG
jgi:protein-disulfide isomerase